MFDLLNMSHSKLPITHLALETPPFGHWVHLLSHLALRPFKAYLCLGLFVMVQMHNIILLCNFLFELGCDMNEAQFFESCDSLCETPPPHFKHFKILFF